MSFFRRKGGEAVGLTIFFATDLHGSDTCFRKFLNARTVYQADVLILGGDLTGKLAVPLLRNGEKSYTVIGPGSPYDISESQRQEVEAGMRKSGYYPFVIDRSDAERFRTDPTLVEDRLSLLMHDRLRAWSDWAQEKLSGTDTEILVAPGNDDPPSIDPLLKSLPRFRIVEGELVNLAGGGACALLSSGYSNRTPWATHREMDEPSLKDYFETIAAKVTDFAHLVCNFHIPPYDSQLDNGPMLDPTTMKVKSGFGQEVSAPVGSRACREFLETHQPLVSLHGHIHESRGVTRIGRTVAINPGSDYGDGILRGALVQISPSGDLVRYQLTSG